MWKGDLDDPGDLVQVFVKNIICVDQWIQYLLPTWDTVLLAAGFPVLELRV